MQQYTLECCVDSVESACLAAQAGATRLELCANLIIGGTTPSPALLERVRTHTNLRVHVLLRPRFGDFLYTEEEFAVLEREVRCFRKTEAEGVVIGCLLPNGRLDLPRMRRLMDAAGGMSVTLHRAFDVCADPWETLREARALGVAAILTSGQAESCLAGKALLKELEEQSGELEIMAGAGVDAEAIGVLLCETGLKSFHMSGKEVLQSGMQFRREGVSMGLPGLSEHEIWRTAPEKVAAAKKRLDEWEAPHHAR